MDTVNGTVIFDGNQKLQSNIDEYIKQDTGNIYIYIKNGVLDIKYLNHRY